MHGYAPAVGQGEFTSSPRLCPSAAQARAASRSTQGRIPGPCLLGQPPGALRMCTSTHLAEPIPHAVRLTQYAWPRRPGADGAPADEARRRIDKSAAWPRRPGADGAPAIEPALTRSLARDGHGAPVRTVIPPFGASAFPGMPTCAGRGAIPRCQQSAPRVSYFLRPTTTHPQGRRRGAVARRPPSRLARPRRAGQGAVAGRPCQGAAGYGRGEGFRGRRGRGPACATPHGGDGSAVRARSRPLSHGRPSDALERGARDPGAGQGRRGRGGRCRRGGAAGTGRRRPPPSRPARLRSRQNWTMGPGSPGRTACEAPRKAGRRCGDKTALIPRQTGGLAATSPAPSVPAGTSP